MFRGFKVLPIEQCGRAAEAVHDSESGVSLWFEIGPRGREFSVFDELAMRCAGEEWRLDRRAAFR